MAKQFTDAEWDTIRTFIEAKTAAALQRDHGLPRRRQKSVVIGTFNIRKFGKVENRSDGARDLLERICSRFDLLALQEVMDDLAAVRELKRRLGDRYGLVVSDTTGTFPGDRGNTERLAFVFRWDRVSRTELASDISFDRSKVVKTLYEGRESYRTACDEHIYELGRWREKVRRAEDEGRKKPSKPPPELPSFLTFIRQPHCASFEVKAKSNAEPYELLVVNAHLLYGVNPHERKWEFDALLEWLLRRSRQRTRLYYENLLLLGDCNLEFEDAGVRREEIDALLQSINDTALSGDDAATANFPLLTPHPDRGLLRTNARRDQTYDQIGFFNRDDRLPLPDDNETAGSGGADAYDYGVFDFVDLFARALDDQPFDDLASSRQSYILARTKHDVSDHLPAWVRLPVPGA